MVCMYSKYRSVQKFLQCGLVSIDIYVYDLCFNFFVNCGVFFLSVFASLPFKDSFMTLSHCLIGLICRFSIAC